MGGNGKIMMCTLHIIGENVFRIMFYMENISTADDLTDATTPVFLVSVLVFTHKPGEFYAATHTFTNCTFFLKEDP